MRQLNQTETKDLVVRASKTFYQAFVAFLIAGAVNFTHVAVTKQAVIALVAAAVSAGVNAVITSTKPTSL